MRVLNKLVRLVEDIRMNLRVATELLESAGGSGPPPVGPSSPTAPPDTLKILTAASLGPAPDTAGHGSASWHTRPAPRSPAKVKYCCWITNTSRKLVSFFLN